VEGVAAFVDVNHFADGKVHFFESGFGGPVVLLEEAGGDERVANIVADGAIGEACGTILGLPFREIMGVIERVVVNIEILKPFDNLRRRRWYRDPEFVQFL
jgi:hypothetical protein